MTRYRGYQRCSRIDYADGADAFAVTLCVKPRRPVFTMAERNQALVQQIECLHNDGIAGIYLYCIMPDHVHLVVNPGPQGLSQAVRLLKGRFTAWWRTHGDGQPLWQAGFFDHRIRHSEGFQDKCRYVLENPVRAGLVTKAEDYPWSGSLANR